MPDSEAVATPKNKLKRNSPTRNAMKLRTPVTFRIHRNLDYPASQKRHQYNKKSHASFRKSITKNRQPATAPSCNHISLLRHQPWNVLPHIEHHRFIQTIHEKKTVSCPRKPTLLISPGNQTYRMVTSWKPRDNITQTPAFQENQCSNRRVPLPAELEREVRWLTKFGTKSRRTPIPFVAPPCKNAITTVIKIHTQTPMHAIDFPVLVKRRRKTANNCLPPLHSNVLSRFAYRH
ncbi:hypothetical protein FF011L_51610 [Roseimaritima multifibrata]|uniref:Uncharacterized protein n=1 Tax=Roseimaritima multifibrata TaxID=1930274 RepID=A0A517MN91_9BACT|nr:hypothetical protein FF011L_51610 [Roseimaritima multifibrata]